ncbi:MAG: hypothetical protein RsTaC01_0506 [Candidatus Paraimprobicoccus trichonymphae]|uniref:Lipoprotein n=1 Tax=Candidatus Paraimprobicoccus trichonymphae TaxID=3033793 RepID=A0AA48HWD9_9FIRM|nr:MAG: hypothetical protein RsTaC01_0506 [Candidatus Paraimprobicoccus trichonymphae]
MNFKKIISFSNIVSSIAIVFSAVSIITVACNHKPKGDSDALFFEPYNTALHYINFIVECPGFLDQNQEQETFKKYNFCIVYGKMSSEKNSFEISSLDEMEYIAAIIGYWDFDKIRINTKLSCIIYDKESKKIKINKIEKIDGAKMTLLDEV